MTYERVAVVSSAQTELRPVWGGAQHIDLISAVVAEVFKGTGLTLDDVDFVFDSGSDVLDGRSISNCGFLGAMGAHHKEESRVEEDGLWAAHYGVTKIAAGAARVGLIIAYSKPSEAEVDKFYSSQVEPFFQRPVGFGQAAACGLQAQAWMADSGITRDDLATLTARRWGAAAARRRVQIDSVPDAAAVAAAPMVAAPLSLLMMARPVDGAVAVLISSADIARRASRSPVWITGAGTSADRHAFASRSRGKLDACAAATAMARRFAGWSDAHVDVAEVSGASAAAELMVLEHTGVATPVDAIHGDNRINLSGGTLPADPIMASGLVRLAEASRQLAFPEEYGLKSPRRALAHGSGGVGMQTHCVMALEV
jgi:acetyl-CoA C-acetyltransferase